MPPSSASSMQLASTSRAMRLNPSFDNLISATRFNHEAPPILHTVALRAQPSSHGD